MHSVNEMIFSIDISMMVVTLSNETSTIVNDYLVESDSFATDASNYNNGTSFIDSANCAICECKYNSGFELSELNVSTIVAITELDSAGSSSIGGLGIGAIFAIVLCTIIGVIFLFILGIEYKVNKNNNDIKKNKRKEK